MHKNYQKILDNYGQTFPWINVGGEVYFELQIQNVKKTIWTLSLTYQKIAC